MTEQYTKVTLKNPLFFKTLNGTNEIKYVVTTPFPKEFGCLGTLQWKIINFSNKNFTAIIGQNFLQALKAKIDYDKKCIEILNNILYFEENSYPEYAQNVCNLQQIKRNKIKDNINLSHMNEEECQATLRLLTEFENLFFKEGDVLSCTNEVCHEIITTNERPLYSKIYRYPQVHEDEIKRQIKEMLEHNIIRESNSPYNSPLWIVEKKLDNSGKKKYRIVIDYRKLNEYTIDDRYPIPNLNSLLDKLGRAQYFTILDLAKGFHQIPVREEDRTKTAFSTPFGHYEFIRMPFGLKNAPSTFQRLMNKILHEHINKICVVYMDDILVFGTSLEEHLTNLKLIFIALKKAHLKIQLDKCDFLKKETQFLGHILTTEGIKPNPAKVEIIKNLRLPNTTKKIKSFLGMTGFYRKFIKDYAKIASPMTRFLKKDQTINEYDPNFIASFEKLKQLVTNSPILRYPNFTKKFKITTDASNFAIGAVLSQDGHPVAYASRTLNKHETNYSTIEKELLAIVWAVKYFRPYVFGRQFNLESDHQPLKWLMTKYTGKDISPRLQRWLVNLGEYNFSLEYIKGKTNNIADFLSRVKNYEINAQIESIHGDEDNNSMSVEIETVHSQEQNLGFEVPILDTVVNRFKTQIIITQEKQNTVEQIFRCKRIYIDQKDIDDDRVLNIVRREITKGKVGIYTNLSDHEYYKVHKVIEQQFSGNPNVKFVRCSKLAKDILNAEELRKQIALFHKNESGHCGIIATFEKLKTMLYNPHLKEEITKVINNCDVCSGGKYDRNPIKKKFCITETPHSTNEIVHMDTYVNSKHSFIVFIDKFSKHATCLPLTDRNSITLVTKLQQFLAIKGKINKIVSDNEFNNENVKKFMQDEGIQHHITKPNSHTGNSDIERLNNTITEKIRTLNIENYLPITQQIQKAIMLYNETYHSTIKCSPLEVQNHKVDHTIIYERLCKAKEEKIRKRNKDRENYTETRQEGFIKNYKNLRHKEQPKFRKQLLQGIHTSNIKRPTKFNYPPMV